MRTKFNKIAALFVETNGIYFNHPSIIPYDIIKNALNYKGPYPIIAHPPCQLWGNFAFVNYARWGGVHNTPMKDGGLFKYALDSVNRYGGVLEHPAKTRAWKLYGIRKPIGIGWCYNNNNSWVCEVWQSAYGHKANKATWLYFKSIDGRKPIDLIWDKIKAPYQIGGKDSKRSKDSNKPTLNNKEANATPLLFRDALIQLIIKKEKSI